MESEDKCILPGREPISYDELRKMSPGQRLQLTFELMEEEAQRVREEIKRRHPHASNEELRRRYIAKVLPREDVIAAYKFDPVQFDE